VGLSVSRVGGKAQSKIMRQVASKLRLDLAQYRELVTFTQFGTDLDKTTRAQLTRGERMVEVLKQAQYEPLTCARQVIIIYAGTNGYLDDLAVGVVKKFELQLYKFIDSKFPGFLAEIESRNDLTVDLKNKLDNLIADFKKDFLAKP
jgi:F-type H+/Na+-transporting ATPase subunit alpha